MTQGQFTKEEAQQTIEAFDDLFKSMSRNKRIEYLGHANDIFLFLEAAKRAAPSDGSADDAGTNEGEAGG
jgi:hypothetical protein